MKYSREERLGCVTCGEFFSRPHDHHHGMAAPFTALERCVVPLPLLPHHYGRPYTYPPSLDAPLCIDQEE